MLLLQLVSVCVFEQSITEQIGPLVCYMLFFSPVIHFEIYRVMTPVMWPH